MATSGDDFKYDGQVTIQLTRHGDEISVWPSNELKGGLAISLMDVEEPRTNVGIATPAEWDAFVAAGNAALGRPGPGSTLLEERIVAAIATAIAETDDRPEHVRTGRPFAYVEGLRAALAMAREAGPTVPRGALAPVLALHAQIAEESGEYRANLIEALLTALDAVRADLAPAPTEGR